MTITLIRPLIDLDTRLRDIPELWLRYIEPRVFRGGFLPCWVWTGSIDQNGLALMRLPGHPQAEKRSVAVRRYVANIFWELPTRYYVSHNESCLHTHCVNPAHLVIKPAKHLMRVAGPDAEDA
jgi:hypothetical protein